MKGLCKLLTLAILGVFLINIASANGLFIEQRDFQINKTNNVAEYFYFNITNQETFKFYNITSDSSLITFDKFSLESGQKKTIRAKIESNTDTEEQIKIIGEYYADLGSSNETEIVTISASGLDVCDLELIEGDTIIWKNTLLGNVALKNVDTGQYFSTIFGQDNYTSKFVTSEEFNYQAYKSGLPYSRVCYININPESGYAHSSQYDTSLNVSLKVSYSPTTISTSFLTSSYSMDYNEEKEDIFQITNTGSVVAKIKLSGDWFEFNVDSLDLQPGEQRNIAITVRPFIYETNYTNKTYNKIINIEGNFEKVEKQIDVFIKYKNLGGVYGNSTYDKEYLKNVVNLFCSIYPDDCPKTIVYGNETDKNITFVINEETYRQNILEEDMFREEIRNSINNQNEKIQSLDNKTEGYINNTDITKDEVKNLSEATSSLLGTIGLIVIIVLALITIVIVGVLIIKEKSKMKLGKLFHKREKW